MNENYEAKQQTFENCPNEFRCALLYPYVYFTKIPSNLSSEQETSEKKGHTSKHYDPNN